MNDLLPGLRGELVAAAQRQHRERARIRRVRVALSAAAAVVVLALFAVAYGTSDPAVAGIDITVVDGRIQVRLTDVETRPLVVEDALRDAGLDADVVADAVGPSNVGRFVALPSALEPDMNLLDARTDTFIGFSIPEDFDRPLRLVLGRPADRGEPYAVASDAYAAGEPLSCTGVYGLTLAEVDDALANRTELTVRVHAFDADGTPQGVPQSLDQAADTLPTHRATDVLATASDELLIIATPDGQPAGLNPVNTDQGACHE